MQLQTFKAATMAEALTQVKSAMGSDAIILHTRTISLRAWLGLRRKEMVEITAGKGMKTIRDARARAKAAGSQADGRKSNGPGTYGPNGKPAGSRLIAVEEFNRDVAPPRNAVEGARRLLETPAATGTVVNLVTEQFRTLNERVDELLARARQQQAPDVPGELQEAYAQLLKSQVAPELAQEIVKAVHKYARPDALSQPQYVREKLAEQIEKLLPTAGPIKRTKSRGPHVIALIGPTGVGKTTTLAKLAANLKLREKRKVGIITLDTYRIAAVEQLKRYADILGSPLRVVTNPDELREALRAMAECDFVLIDTAGRSPNDTMKLGELKSLLDTAKPEEVHLVLSSTASQECIELAVQRFGEVRMDKILFTKIDEAAHVGVVLNVVKQANKPLSYLTTGQDVPEDIEVGQGKRLAERILGTGTSGREI